jgi:MSHA pilin protein MshD
LILLNRSIATSADPVIQQQAISIGEAYIEEIIGKAYVASSCPSTPGADRSRHDDVCDYNNLDSTGAIGQSGGTIRSLKNLKSYRVHVDVNDATLNGADAKLITVTVKHSGIPDIVLSAYRLDLS